MTASDTQTELGGKEAPKMDVKSNTNVLVEIKLNIQIVLQPTFQKHQLLSQILPLKLYPSDCSFFQFQENICIFWLDVPQE